MREAQRGNPFHGSWDMTYDSVVPAAATSAPAARVHKMAPSGVMVLDYDRNHLALYAALLDADKAGSDWQDAASRLMQLDITEATAEACWRSHLDRARWIVGEGLGSALVAFNAPRIANTAE